MPLPPFHRLISALGYVLVVLLFLFAAAALVAIVIVSWEGAKRL